MTGHQHPNSSKIPAPTHRTSIQVNNLAATKCSSECVANSSDHLLFQTWNGFSLSLSLSFSLCLLLYHALSCSISGEFFWNMPRECCRFIHQQHQTRPRVEGIISAADGLVRRHLTIRLDTMLQAEKLPASIADLHTWLAIRRSDHRKPQTSNCSLFAISTDFKPFSLFGGSMEDTCRCNIGGQAGCWTWVADFTGYLPPFTTRNHPRYAQKYQKPNRAVLKPSRTDASKLVQLAPLPGEGL